MDLTKVSILLLSIGVLLALFIVWVLTTRHSLKKYEANANVLWTPVRNELSKRFDLISNIEKFLDLAKLDEESTNVTEIKTQLNRCKNAYAKAYKGYDSNEASKGEALLKEKVVPELSELSENPTVHPAVISKMKELDDSLKQSTRQFNEAAHAFNDSILRHNTRINSFPTNFVANFLNMEEKDPIAVKKRSKAK